VTADEDRDLHVDWTRSRSAIVKKVTKFSSIRWCSVYRKDDCTAARARACAR